MSEQERESLKEQFEAVQAVTAQLETLPDGSKASELASRLAEQADSEFNNALEGASGETRLYLIDRYQGTSDELTRLEAAEQTLRENAIEVPYDLSEKIVVLRESFSDPEMQIAERYLIGESAGYTATKATTIEVPVPMPEPTEGTTTPEELSKPEVETHYSELTMNVSRREDGSYELVYPPRRRIELSSRKYEAQKDYTAWRIAALKAVTASGLTGIRTRDLWRSMCNSVNVECDDIIPTIDPNIMVQAKRFFMNLSYNHQPIFLKHGDRGPGVFYTTNPNLTHKKILYAPVFDIEDEQIRQIEQEISKNQEILASLPETQLEEIADKSRERDQRALSILPSAEELNSLTSLIGINFDNYQKLLDELEVNRETSLHSLLLFIANSADSISDLANLERESKYTVPERSDEEIQAQRVVVLSKIKQLFSDEQLFNDALELLGSSDEDNEYMGLLYHLLENLIVLDEEEWEILQNLIETRFENEASEYAGSYHEGAQIIGIVATLANFKGVVYRLTNDRGDGPYISDARQGVITQWDDSRGGDAALEEDASYDDVSILERSPEEPESVIDTFKDMVGREVIDKLRGVGERSKADSPHTGAETIGVSDLAQAPEDQIYVQIEKQVKEDLEVCIKGGLANGASTGHLQGVFNGIGSPQVKNASENNLISENNGRTVSLEDILLLRVAKLFPKTVERRREVKKIRRMIKNITSARLPQ